MRDYYKSDNAAYLKTMLAFIEVETINLEKERSLYHVNFVSTDIIDNIGRLMKPIKPIIMIWVFIWILIIFISMSLESYTLDQYIYIGILFISVFFALILISVLFSLYTEKKLSRQGGYRWILIVGIISPPVLTIVLSDLYILFVLIQILSLILLIRAKKNRSSIILIDDK